LANSNPNPFFGGDFSDEINSTEQIEHDFKSRFVFVQAQFENRSAGQKSVGKNKPRLQVLEFYSLPFCICHFANNLT
jgi:hypothetical protein